MGQLLLNMRYLLAPILIIVAGAGVLVGGIMAWLGVVLLFVGLLVDIATKFETTGVGFDENGDTLGWPTFQNLTMYFMLPVFVLFQLVMAWRVFSYMSLGGAEGAVIMEIIPGLLVMHEGITGLTLSVQHYHLVSLLESESFMVMSYLILKDLDLQFQD